MHENRHWRIRQATTPEELTELLSGMTWCCCQGFELEGHLWLNDSTSPDAVQEYAVVTTPSEVSEDYRQIESISVSWCNQQQLAGYIRQFHGGETPESCPTGPVAVARSSTELFDFLGITDGPQGVTVEPRLEPEAQHVPCKHCR